MHILLTNLLEQHNEVDLDRPFHNEAVAEVMARQWWLGQHPEALREGNQSRFDLNKPLSSNMIALVCSAVSATSILPCSSMFIDAIPSCSFVLTRL